MQTIPLQYHIRDYVRLAHTFALRRRTGQPIHPSVRLLCDISLELHEAKRSNDRAALASLFMQRSPWITLEDFQRVFAVVTAWGPMIRLSECIRAIERHGGADQDERLWFAVTQERNGLDTVLYGPRIRDRAFFARCIRIMTPFRWNPAMAKRMEEIRRNMDLEDDAVFQTFLVEHAPELRRSTSFLYDKGKLRLNRLLEECVTRKRLDSFAIWLDVLFVIHERCPINDNMLHAFEAFDVSVLTPRDWEVLWYNFYPLGRREVQGAWRRGQFDVLRVMFKLDSSIPRHVYPEHNPTPEQIAFVRSLRAPDRNGKRGQPIWLGEFFPEDVVRRIEGTDEPQPKRQCIVIDD